MLVWAKAEGAPDSEAFRVTVAPSTVGSSQDPSEVYTPTVTIRDVLNAVLALFLSPGSSPRRRSDMVVDPVNYGLYLRGFLVEPLSLSAEDVVKAELAAVLDVEKTVNNRDGTVSHFTLMRRRGIVFELRSKSSAKGKKGEMLSKGHFHHLIHQKKTSVSVSSVDTSDGNVRVPPNTIAGSSSRGSSSGARSPNKPETSPFVVSPPAALKEKAVLSADNVQEATSSSQMLAQLAAGGGPAALLWAPKTEREKSLHVIPCKSFHPKWSVPEVCEVCLHLKTSHKCSSPSGKQFRRVDASVSPPRQAADGDGSHPTVVDHSSDPSPSSLRRHLDATACTSPPSSSNPNVSAYRRTCGQFQPLWNRNDYCNHCWRPAAWHHEYLIMQDVKRRQHQSDMMQYRSIDRHRSVMNTEMPWPAILSFLTVEELMTCAQASKALLYCARPLLHSVMQLVLTFEQPNDVKMKILREAQAIASALRASKSMVAIKTIEALALCGGVHSLSNTIRGRMTRADMQALVDAIHTLVESDPRTLSDDAVAAIKAIPLNNGNKKSSGSGGGLESHPSAASLSVSKSLENSFSPSSMRHDEGWEDADEPILPLVHFMDSLASLRHLKQSAHAYLGRELLIV